MTESSDKGRSIKVTINGCEQIYAADEVSQMPELLYADLYAVGRSAKFAAMHTAFHTDNLIFNSLVLCLLKVHAVHTLSLSAPCLGAIVLRLPQPHMQLDGPLAPYKSLQEHLCHGYPNP